VAVRAQGHVEQHEQANREGVEDKASHAGLIGTGRLVVERLGPAARYRSDGGTAMSEPKVIHIDQIEAAHGGVFKPVGRTLGATAFGINVEQYPQGHDQYPDHDHASDGQEEVYYVVSGQATLTIDGDDHIMRAGSMAYVPAGHSRRFTTPDQGVQFLAIGGNAWHAV
jgi:mannose-6-phosphate isomerase-like protein (cupin superfamily)